MAYKIEDIQAKIQPIFDQFQNEPTAEIELRLGKHNGRNFDTNVGKDAFDRCLAGLRGYDGWEQVIVSNADIYYNDAENIRLTVDGNTGEQTMVKKTRHVVEDFSDASAAFDVRFAVSTETPVSGQYPAERKIIRERHSFFRKNLAIDASIVQSVGGGDQDAEDGVTYQIELEIVDATRVECAEQLFNILYKVNDVLKLM
tara:strand:- start:188 stop:787 length:600 start_codon:yes stop_codon:yes gene_type:complete